jgi:excisionase family DNA binding protein
VTDPLFTDPDDPRGLTRQDIMTAKDVADMLGVPVSTVLHWGRTGTLPRLKLGKHVRFIRAHVAAALLDHENHPPRHSG